MSHLHVKKAPVGLLRRACLCHAGDDREDGAAGEDEFADSQELAGTTGSIAQEPEESESSEEARRAAFIAEYFQSSYDPMYHGKWIDVQGASMKMPDYDFSQYDWMSRVPTDIGWPTFWKCAFFCLHRRNNENTLCPSLHRRKRNSSSFNLLSVFYSDRSYALHAIQEDL